MLNSPTGRRALSSWPGPVLQYQLKQKFKVMATESDHKGIIKALESISGKEMTIDNFMLFMKEILPNGYSRDFTKAEIDAGYDQLLLNLNSE